MKNNFVWVLLTLGFAALSAVLGFQLYSLSGDVTVASVNGEKITKEEVYQKLSAQYGGELVNSLIDDKLINQEARKADMKVTPDEIKTEMAKIKANFPSEVEFQVALTQAGLNQAELEEKVGSQLLLKKILTPKVQEKVTDVQVKEYFEANRTKFDQPAQVRAAHILVKTEEEAKAILDELAKGGDFAAIAKAKSLDPGSKDNGGDLDFFTADRMVKPFSDAAFSMNVGQISGAVQSEFGYHIIKVTDKKAAVTPKFEDVQVKIKDDLTNQELQKLVPEWLKETKGKASITNTLEKKETK